MQRASSPSTLGCRGGGKRSRESSRKQFPSDSPVRKASSILKHAEVEPWCALGTGLGLEEELVVLSLDEVTEKILVLRMRWCLGAKGTCELK